MTALFQRWRYSTYTPMTSCRSRACLFSVMTSSNGDIIATSSGIVLLVHLVIFELSTTIQVFGLALAPVYWNISNPVFKPSMKSHVIEVNMHDNIDFVCPFYQPEVTSNFADVDNLGYYIVYQVSRRAYDECDLSFDGSLATVIVNCSTPTIRRRFTMWFEKFQAIPNAPEFQPGNTYFFISTSTGRKNELTNTKGGACHNNNLKLTVSVCCKSRPWPTGSNVTITVPSTDIIRKLVKTGLITIPARAVTTTTASLLLGNWSVKRNDTVLSTPATSGLDVAAAAAVGSNERSFTASASSLRRSTTVFHLGVSVYIFRFVNRQSC